MNDSLRYRTVESNDIRLLVREDCPDELVQRLLRGPRFLCEYEGAEVVRRTMTRSVVRLPLEADSGRFGFLKRDSAAGLIRVIKYSLLGSPMRKEWSNALRLAKLGVPTISPLVFGEKRRFGLVLEDYILTEEIEGAVNLRDYFRDVSADERRRILLRLAPIVARMHAAGFCHPDLHLGNILIRTSAGEPELFIIDLHRIRRDTLRLLGRWMRMRDLAALRNSVRAFVHGDVWREFLEAYSASDRSFRSRIEGYSRRIEEIAERIQRRRLKSRTRRCLKNSTGFEVTRERGRKIFRRRSFPPETVSEAVTGHDGSISSQRNVLKMDDRTRVTHNWKLEVCVKEFVYSGFWDKLRNTLIPSRGLREWTRGNGMLVRGIETCEYLALVEEYERGFKKRSLIVMKDIGEARTIDEYIYFDILGSPVERRREFTRSMARFFADLHDRGIFHRDLKASNILVKWISGRGFCFFPIDLESVRFQKSLSPKQVARNLAQINSSLHLVVTDWDRMRFFKEYLKLRGREHERDSLLPLVLHGTLKRYCAWKRPEAPIRRLRILHLFGEWKWTGPSEPILTLCKQQKEMGHKVWLACKRPPDGQSGALIQMAEEAGVTVLTDFALDRGILQKHFIRDLFRLRRFLRENAVDVLHVHQGYDHFLAALAARKKSIDAVVIRTNHKGEPLSRRRLERLLLKKFTEGLVEVSEKAMRADSEVVNTPNKCILALPGATDLSRFRPSAGSPGKRRELGVADDDIVVGIVARMQRHRKFDLLLEGFALAAREMPNLKLLIIGRGTHKREVVMEPVERMRLKEKVILAGYRTGGDYVETLSVFDMKVFLVPGSDGSCRAVREAMAMGKPVIATRRGALPEIIVDGETGLLIDETPKALKEAILRLARDGKLRERMGAAARRLAEQRFRIEPQAKRIEDLYISAILRRRRGG